MAWIFNFYPLKWLFRQNQLQRLQSWGPDASLDTHIDCLDQLWRIWQLWPYAQFGHYGIRAVAASELQLWRRFCLKKQFGGKKLKIQLTISSRFKSIRYKQSTNASHQGRTGFYWDLNLLTWCLYIGVKSTVGFISFGLGTNEVYYLYVGMYAWVMTCSLPANTTSVSSPSGNSLGQPSTSLSLDIPA